MPETSPATNQLNRNRRLSLSLLSVVAAGSALLAACTSGSGNRGSEELTYQPHIDTVACDPVTADEGDIYSVSNNPNARAAFEHFTTVTSIDGVTGLPHRTAAVIVGVMEAESYVDPKSVARTDDGRGVLNWGETYSSKLWAFAVQNSQDPTELETQLEFVDHQLATDKKFMLADVASATDTATAAGIFNRDYTKNYHMPCDPRYSLYASAVEQSF